MTRFRFNIHKWNFYSLFRLPYYAPFNISYEEAHVYILQFYLNNRHYTNREITALFSVAYFTLTCHKSSYDEDLRRRNERISSLANKYGHCNNKDKRIQRGLRWFVPKHLLLEGIILGRWWVGNTLVRLWSLQ